MISLKSFVFSPFSENTYVAFDETKECIIIDPGCYESHEKDQLVKFISTNKLKPVKLVNTHGHIDHVLGNDFVKTEFNISLYIHEAEKPILESVKNYASTYGFIDYIPTVADHFIKEGGSIDFGNSILEILFVPGHSPGHIALVNKEQKMCISGDVLFKGSIGRTDLPGGDFDTLIKSIHEEIFPLGDEMVIFNGHGDETTVGEEKLTNPFCALK